MVVQERVKLPALPVGEAGRQYPKACDMLKVAAGLAPARSDGLVEVADRGFDAGVMRGQGGARQLGTAEPIQSCVPQLMAESRDTRG